MDFKLKEKRWNTAFLLKKENTGKRKLTTFDYVEVLRKKEW